MRASSSIADLAQRLPAFPVGAPCGCNLPGARAMPQAHRSLVGLLRWDNHPIQGRAFGNAAVKSVSRNMPPSVNPSRIQPSACHQSSYARRAASICLESGENRTGQARTSTVRRLPLTCTCSVPTTSVTARSPCRLRFISTGTQRGTAPGIQSGVIPSRVKADSRGIPKALQI